MVMRFVVAIVASLPVAIIASISLTLAVGGGGVGEVVAWVSFVLVWIAMSAYAVQLVEVKRVFGRTALGYAIAAFSLPVAALLFTFVSGAEAMLSAESEGEQAAAAIIVGFFGAAIVVVSLVFGLFTEAIAAILAHVTLRSDAR